MKSRNFNTDNEMGMKKKILKGASYIAAPKLTFAAQHPRKAAMIKAGTWVAGRVMPHRRSHSTGMSLAKGLGAAAVALPIGLWLGRRVFQQRQPQAI